MLRQQAEERSSGATMFKSGGAVVKRGYVWSKTAIAATMYNLKANTDVAGLRPPPAVSAKAADRHSGHRQFFDPPPDAGSKTNTATSPTADATAAAENSQT
jgi:hypothetical protein